MILEILEMMLKANLREVGYGEVSTRRCEECVLPIGRLRGVKQNKAAWMPDLVELVYTVHQMSFLYTEASQAVII